MLTTEATHDILPAYSPSLPGLCELLKIPETKWEYWEPVAACKYALVWRDGGQCAAAIVRGRIRDLIRCYIATMDGSQSECVNGGVQELCA